MKSEKAKPNLHGDCIAMELVPATSERREIASNDRGFTLVEVVLVCIILGILVTLSIPAYNSSINLAKVARCKEEIRTLEKEINAYQADRGVLPSNLTQIPNGNIRDPWGNLYNYRPASSTVADPPRYTDFSGAPLNSDYDLYSTGQDGTSTYHLSSADADKSSRDDIVRAGEGAFDELGSEVY